MNTSGYNALAVNREGKLFRSDGIDIDAATSAIKANVAIHERENRVIAAETNVLARLKFRAALANNNIARDNHLAAEFFNAQPFANAIAAVLNAALSFFI